MIAASLLALSLQVVPPPTAPPPNIVHIVLDEWGYYEMSCLGHPKLRTPNLDQLVAGGMRFTQALAGAPVCGPSRVSLMLGRHTGHTPMRENSGFLPIRGDDVTIAEVLRSKGYATGGFGKWGCGGRGTTGVPERHGFDEFFGYYDQRHAHTYFPRYLIRNGAQIKLPGNTGDYYEGETWSQHVIFDASMDFLEAHADGPFYLYLPWTPPHGRWGIPEDEPAWLEIRDEPWTAGKVRDTDSRAYAAVLSVVDRQIGQVLARLERLGIAERTLVIVTGDNGGQDYFADEEHPRGFFAPNVDPLTGVEFRGQKGDLFEGGLRVPAIAYWPGQIEAGVVSDHPWYFPDLMPTFAELVGAELPAGVDGISILPTLLGQRPQPRHGYFYWEHKDSVAVRCGRWKAVRPNADKPWRLFDLEADVSETVNLAHERPEVLGLLRAMADEAHRPPRLGYVLDRELTEKDRRLKKE